MLCSESARIVPAPAKQKKNEEKPIPDVLHLFSNDGTVDVREALKLNSQPAPAVVPVPPVTTPTADSVGVSPTAATSEPTPAAVPQPPSAGNGDSSDSSNGSTDSSNGNPETSNMPVITIITPENDDSAHNGHESSSQDDQGGMTFGTSLYLLLFKSLFSVFDGATLDAEPSSDNGEHSSIFMNSISDDSSQTDPEAPQPLAVSDDSDSQRLTDSQTRNPDYQTPPTATVTETTTEKPAENGDNEKKPDQETGAGSVEPLQSNGNDSTENPPPATCSQIENAPTNPQPEDPAANNNAAAESPPAGSTPAESTPVETTSVETTPVETTPVETTSAETTQAENPPAETTPVENPAAEAPSADNRPADPPAENAPAENNSVESPPATATAENPPAENAPAASADSAEVTPSTATTTDESTQTTNLTNEIQGRDE